MKTIVLTLVLATLALTASAPVALPQAAWTVSMLSQDSTATGTRYRMEIRAVNTGIPTVSGSAMFYSTAPFDGYAIGQAVTATFALDAGRLAAGK